MARVNRIPLLLNLLVVAAAILAWQSGWLPGLAELGLAELGLIAPQHAASPAPADEAAPTASPLRIRAIRPRRDEQTKVTVTQPAEVAAYYSVQLFAERAGTVPLLEKERGDDVSAGEMVIEIRDSSSGQNLQLTSPIDGVITSRSVDPGTFVPSAAIIPGAAPLLTISRIDIVTVTMNVPDAFSPFVTLNSLATIRDPAARNVPPIETRLTRISPLVRASDRTLQVQVELFNENRQDYDELLAEEKANDFAVFKSRKPPEFPRNFSETQSAGLVPGMLCEMQLTLQQFAQIPVIPSSSLVRRSGKTHVYQIIDDQLVEVPVKLQLDDGTTAYVKKLRRHEGVSVEEDWTGDEWIAWAVAGDLQPGRTVKASLTQW